MSVRGSEPPSRRDTSSPVVFSLFPGTIGTCEAEDFPELSTRFKIVYAILMACVFAILVWYCEF